MKTDNKKNRNKPAAVTVPADTNTQIAELQQQILALQERQKVEAEAQRVAKVEMFTRHLTEAGITKTGREGLTEYMAVARTFFAPVPASSNGGTSGRGRRIDEAVKIAVDVDVKAQKDTAKDIAARHGVSVPYVQGRRKELGLVGRPAAAAGV